MSVDTNVNGLVINLLTKQQYEGINSPSDTELYLITDDIGFTLQEILTVLGYTPENNGNKVTTLTAQSTDTQYPSAKCVYDRIAAIETSIGNIQTALQQINSGTSNNS